MSAFICDSKTISAIAKAFVEYGVSYEAENYRPKLSSDLGVVFFNVSEAYNNIGQSLLDKNYKSVNYRYGEDTETPEFQYEEVEIDEGIVYGCIECYDYQACEEPDYFESKLHGSLIRLENALLEKLLKRANMSAPYGYDGHDILNY